MLFPAWLKRKVFSFIGSWINFRLSSSCFITRLINRNLVVFYAFLYHVNWKEVIEVHLVFSLNVTFSFTDGIIRVVSSVRYRLHVQLLAKKLLYKEKLKLVGIVLPWIKRFFSLYRRKKYLSHISIVQQHFDGHILSRGTPPSWKIMEIPRGGGYRKTALCGWGGGGVWIFSRTTIQVLFHVSETNPWLVLVSFFKKNNSHPPFRTFLVRIALAILDKIDTPTNCSSKLRLTSLESPNCQRFSETTSLAIPVKK